MPEWLADVLSGMGLSKLALIPAAIGSLISFKFNTELGLLGRISTFVGGTYAGGAVSPWIMDVFSIKPAYIGAVGFIVGALAMSVLGAVIQGIRETKLGALLTRRLGGGQL